MRAGYCVTSGSGVTIVEAVDDGLADEHAIERIGMEVRQLHDVECRLFVDRERGDSVARPGRRHQAIGRTGSLSVPFPNLTAISHTDAALNHNSASASLARMRSGIGRSR